MIFQKKTIVNELVIGHDEILKDGWANISRFSNSNNYGDLARNFTLVAMGSSGLLPESFLYDEASIRFANDELTQIVHAYNKYKIGML